MPDQSALSCSARSELVAEPLLGTAAYARAWVVLEQPGPWGRRALTQSHLDPELGAELDRRAAGADARVALVRRPGRHADTQDPRSFRLWVAWTQPGQTWLLGGWITDPDRLRDLDWTALGAGDANAVAASVPELSPDDDPLLLVCTNGRRDVCCALRGRQLVDDVHDDLLGRVWESIHLGGHRFAPTALVLPHGTSHGRLTAELALEIMDGARRGLFVPAGYRGRTTYPKPAQAAEGAVRQHANTHGLDDLDVTTVDLAGDTWHVAVRHTDGRTWDVTVQHVEHGTSRPESCGANPEPVATYQATDVTSPNEGAPPAARGWRHS